MEKTKISIEEKRKSVIAQNLEITLKLLHQSSLSSNSLSEKDREIFRDHLLGMSKKELAKKYSLTPSRIGTIVDYAYRKNERAQLNFEPFMESEYHKGVRHCHYWTFETRESERFYGKHVLGLIQSLEAENALSKFEKNFDKLPISRPWNKDERKKFGYKMMKRISEEDFSERALNCLYGAEIHTLGDLLSFETFSSQEEFEYEILKIRNFGKKSLEEVLEFLSKNRVSLETYFTKK